MTVGKFLLHHAVATITGPLNYDGTFFERPESTLTLSGQTFTLSHVARFGFGDVDLPLVNGSGEVLLAGKTYIRGLEAGGSVSLVNTKTVYENGNLQLGEQPGSSASVVNAATGVWLLGAGSKIGAAGAGDIFYNNGGTLWKTTSGTAVIDATIANTGQAPGLIYVSGGALELNGQVTGAETMKVASGASLVLAHPENSAATVDLLGSQSALELRSSDAFYGQLLHFSAGDSIDLAAFDPTGLSLLYANGASGGTLSLHEGTMNASLHFAGDYTSANFKMGSDGHGGALITYGNS